MIDVSKQQYIIIVIIPFYTLTEQYIDTRTLTVRRSANGAIEMCRYKHVQRIDLYDAIRKSREAVNANDDPTDCIRPLCARRAAEITSV